MRHAIILVLLALVLVGCVDQKIDRNQLRVALRNLEEEYRQDTLEWAWPPRPCEPETVFQMPPGRWFTLSEYVKIAKSWPDSIFVPTGEARP